jgi:alkylated DNA repair dioxygenase AlkB
VFGPELLDDLAVLTGIRYPIVAFQGYRDGAGCDWHTDDPFDAQAVLSLGVTRTFGYRPAGGGEPTWVQVGDGDLVVMPSGFQTAWQHCVPVEDVPGERVSLVFRTPRR